MKKLKVTEPLRQNTNQHVNHPALQSWNRNASAHWEGEVIAPRRILARQHGRMQSVENFKPFPDEDTMWRGLAHPSESHLHALGWEGMRIRVYR